MAPTSSQDPASEEVGDKVHVESLEEYFDFLSDIIISAPDEFDNFNLSIPYHINLEVAFRVAREGMAFVEERVSDPVVLARLRGLIEESYQAFSSFDFEGRKKGSLTMQQFEKELLEAVRNAPKKKKGPWG